ncbi:MAG: Uma2 family endonuclease [Janthinobacterium lividum]
MMPLAPAVFSSASALLDDLTPDSGLTLRRWTPDEFRRMASSELLSTEEALELIDGEIMDRYSRAPRLFHRSEYYNLTNFGLLGPEERTELIYGRIITRMSPMRRPHSLGIIKTAEAVQTAFGNEAAVEQQMPLHVKSGIEPEPDVVVLQGLSEDYLDAPYPADVLLLVEVSYSTLRYDRNTKAAIYAENGISDYWIVDLHSRALEVRRDPENGKYVSLRVYGEDEAVAPLAAPNESIKVADLLSIVRG